MANGESASAITRQQVLEINAQVRKHLLAWISAFGVANLAVVGGFLVTAHSTIQSGFDGEIEEIRSMNSALIENEVGAEIDKQFGERGEAFEEIVDKTILSLTDALSQSGEYIGQTNLLERQASEYFVRIEQVGRTIDETEAAASAFKEAVARFAETDQGLVLDLVARLEEQGLDAITQRLNRLEQELRQAVRYDDVVQIYFLESRLCIRAKKNQRSGKDVVLAGCDISEPAATFKFNEK